MSIYLKYRLQNNLQQSEAAARCGITQAYWSVLERNPKKITLDVVHGIMKGTGLTIEEITRDYFKRLRARRKAASGENRRAARKNTKRKK